MKKISWISKTLFLFCLVGSPLLASSNNDGSQQLTTENNELDANAGWKKHNPSPKPKFPPSRPFGYFYTTVSETIEDGTGELGSPAGIFEFQQNQPPVPPNPNPHSNILNGRALIPLKNDSSNPDFVTDFLVNITGDYLITFDAASTSEPSGVYSVSVVLNGSVIPATNHGSLTPTAGVENFVLADPSVWVTESTDIHFTKVLHLVKGTTVAFANYNYEPVPSFTFADIVLESSTNETTGVANVGAEVTFQLLRAGEHTDTDIPPAA